MGKRTEAAFDVYAQRYDCALGRGLALTGEGRDYFAARRVALLGRRLRGMGLAPRLVIDYGCGDGATLPVLARELAPQRVVGVEVSTSCAAMARRAGGGQWVVVAPGCHEFDGQAELIYCSGVLHHVEPVDRREMLLSVRRLLVPGGVFALWENNPWNPGTRWVMSRIAFDRDAIPLSAWRARSLLRAAGFSVISTDHAFIFPRCLGWLRPIEALLGGLPFGGQYMILGQPHDGAARARDARGNVGGVEQNGSMVL